MRRVATFVALVSATLCFTGAKAWGQNSAQTGSDQKRVFLGVGIEPTAPDAKHPGVIVRSVVPDSPAAKAGLKEGDIIEKAGKTDVRDIDSLIGALRQHRPGEQVTFHVFRNDQEQKVNVTLGQHPARQPGQGGLFSDRGAFLGVQTQPFTPQLKEKLNVSTDHGVVIADVLPDTPAANAGLKRDDVIVSFAGKAIDSPKELRDAVHAAGAGKEVSITVLRGQEKKEMHVRPEESPIGGLFGQGGFGPGTFPTPFEGRLTPSIIQNLQRVPQLERKVQELEKRVRELEQNRNK